MASRDKMYDHIVRELLQAQIDSPIDTLLRDAKGTTLRKLRQYLRKPGLATYKWRDSKDEDKMKDFPDDMQEDLLADLTSTGYRTTSALPRSAASSTTP